MQFTEGTITAILPRGFRLKTIWDSELDCHTTTAGHLLPLSVGDRVRVTGGSDSQGGFATSSIERHTANGVSEAIHDRPQRGWLQRVMQMVTRRR